MKTRSSTRKQAAAALAMEPPQKNDDKSELNPSNEKPNTSHMKAKDKEDHGEELLANEKLSNHHHEPPTHKSSSMRSINDEQIPNGKDKHLRIFKHSCFLFDTLLKQILVELSIEWVGQERRKVYFQNLNQMNGNTKNDHEENNSYSIEDRVEVFPQVSASQLPLEKTHVVCDHCKRSIANEVYAPHLERCMNVRNSRRNGGRNRTVVDYSEDTILDFDEEDHEVEPQTMHEVEEASSTNEHAYAESVPEELPTKSSPSRQQSQSKSKKKTNTKPKTKAKKKRGAQTSDDDEDYVDEFLEPSSEEFEDDRSYSSTQSERGGTSKRKVTRSKKATSNAAASSNSNGNNSKKRKTSNKKQTRKANNAPSSDEDLMNMSGNSSSEDDRKQPNAGTINEEDAQSVSSSERLLNYIDSSSSQKSSASDE